MVRQYRVIWPLSISTHLRMAQFFHHERIFCAKRILLLGNLVESSGRKAGPGLAFGKTMMTKLFPGSCLAVLLMGAVGFTGCGGAQPAPNGSSPDGAAHLHHEGGGPHHEGNHDHVFPTLDEFHTLYAPIWHTESDSERVSKACEKHAAIHAQVQKIEEGPVPEKVTDQAAWKAAAHALMEDADALRKDCDTGREAVLPRLKSIHDGYHGLVDRAQGKLQK